MTFSSFNQLYESGTVLMACDVEGLREVVAIVSSLSEARAAAREDLESRDPDTDLCPLNYSVQERGRDGRYREIEVIDV